MQTTDRNTVKNYIFTVHNVACRK